MSNKRTLKKEINYLVFDVIDECIYIQEMNESKVAPSEKIIEEAIEYCNQALSDMNAGKNKADFRKVANDLDIKTEYFFEKLNALNQ